MLKKIKSYLKDRRERKLRRYLTFTTGRSNTSAEIQEWVEFILYKKPTSVRIRDYSRKEREKAIVCMFHKRREDEFCNTKNKSYINNLRERRLIVNIAFQVGRYNTPAEIQEWVEFILYGKPTTALLMSFEDSRHGHYVMRILDHRKKKDEEGDASLVQS